MGSSTVVRGNIGYITENSGSLTVCVNGTWIAHGLVGDPLTTGKITLALRGPSAYNATIVLRVPTVLASNNTHFQIEFLAWKIDITLRLNSHCICLVWQNVPH